MLHSNCVLLVRLVLRTILVLCRTRYEVPGRLVDAYCWYEYMFTVLVVTNKAQVRTVDVWSATRVTTNCCAAALICSRNIQPSSYTVRFYQVPVSTWNYCYYCTRSTRRSASIGFLFQQRVPSKIDYVCLIFNRVVCGT